MKCEKCGWDMVIEALPITEKYKDTELSFPEWNYHCLICGKVDQDTEMIEWSKKSKAQAIKEYEYIVAHPVIKGKRK